MTNLELWKSLLRVKKRKCGSETLVHAVLMDRSISTVQKLRGKKKIPQFRGKAWKTRKSLQRLWLSLLLCLVDIKEEWEKVKGDLLTGQVVLMDHRFPHAAALRCGSAWQFILALSRLNNTISDTQQILLKIPRAACSLLPKTQKSVLPHGNLSGLSGWLWKWFGLRQD